MTELRQTQRLLTNAPLHLRALGAPFENRPLLYVVQGLASVAPFLLPPDASEMRTTLARMQARDR